MKKIVTLIVMAFIYLTSYSQTLLEYSKTLPVEGKTKEEILKVLRPFIVTSYDSNKDIVTNSDSIVVEGYSTIAFVPDILFSSIEGKINYTARLVLKDGSLRFINTDFTHEPGHKAAFNNNMGVLVDPLPKDLSIIGVKGLNRKGCYKYFYKLGTILCKEKYDKQVEKLIGFLYK